MGLDILLFDNDNRLLSMLEIDEALHKDIFAPHKRWASYLYLRKLNDYYCTNEEYSGAALDGLVTDLINYIPLMMTEYPKKVQLLLDAISDRKVNKVKIKGD